MAFHFGLAFKHLLKGESESNKCTSQGTTYFTVVAKLHESRSSGVFRAGFQILKHPSDWEHSGTLLIWPNLRLISYIWIELGKQQCAWHKDERKGPLLGFRGHDLLSSAKCFLLLNIFLPAPWYEVFRITNISPLIFRKQMESHGEKGDRTEGWA